MNFVDELRQYPDCDSLVTELLSGEGQYFLEHRARLCDMFENFRQSGLGDRNFVEQFAKHPIRMYWEMLVGCMLLAAKHRVSHVRQGPDFRLNHDEDAIWVEATAPSGGTVGCLDSVLQPVDAEAYFFPIVSVEQRVTGSIAAKLRQWDKSWSNVINSDAPFVLAVNTFECGVNISGLHVANAVFGVGPLTWRLRSTEDGDVELVDEFYMNEKVLRKANGSPINKAGFLDGSLSRVSAVLHGHFNLNWPVDAASRAITVIHNPTADNKIAPGALRIGRELGWELNGGRASIVELKST